MTDARNMDRNYLAFAARAGRKDMAPILLLGVVAGIIAGGMAFRAPSATSNAQLVLTPIPVYAENQNEVEDIPTKLLVEPLDIRSAALLCKSDETLLRTQKLLEKKPLKDLPSLAALRGSLQCEITIAAESPMEIAYSPILRLSAAADTPARAKQRVDAWSEACVAMAVEYKAKRQGAIAEAFAAQATGLEARLRELETNQQDTTLDHARLEALLDAHAEAIRRAEYAKVGASGEPSELQLLSPGAEWPASRLRPTLKALFFGALAGSLAAACLSFAVRLLNAAALESPAP